MGAPAVLDGFFAQIGCTTLVDCNDADPLTSPVAAELCDTLDNDCDLLVDEDIDLDADPLELRRMR